MAAANTKHKTYKKNKKEKTYMQLWT